MAAPLNVTVDPETEASIRGALQTSAQLIEQARALGTEREANHLLASSLLLHADEPEVDISKYPGGVQDAWVVLSEASKQQSSQKQTIDLYAATEKEQEKLPMGTGQLGKAIQHTTLSDSLQKVVALDKELKQLEKDKSRVLKKAISTAKTSVHGSMVGPVWLKLFDERLHEIRSYHARHDSGRTKRSRLGDPVADGYDLASSVAETIQPIKEGTMFDAEEVMGKYLDLTNVYESTVVPIKHVFATPPANATTTNKAADFGFVDFLSLLSAGINMKVSEEKKLKDRRKYVKFLNAMQAYLEDFLKRTQPLLDLKGVIEPAIKEFEEDWRQTGGCDGWEAKPAEKSMVSSDGAATDATSGIDLSPYSSAAELEKAVDGDALKAELSRLGLKCGGTVADRAKRLFTTKDTPMDKLPKKFFAKKAKGGAAGVGAPASTAKNESRVDVARREAIVIALFNQLKPTLEATLKRSERRETQTNREREKEMNEDLHGSEIKGPKEKKEGEDEEDSDDEDAPIYNPKGVPLGWDGKPIPYWLFKLHGLNHFYTCEICGNEAYRGRRNFEMHFAESKHAFGMKCLEIPNTKHFHGVTTIEDAKNLWDKLKHQLQRQEFDGSKEEEYEDSHGNVLSRSTYEDLARQGML